MQEKDGVENVKEFLLATVEETLKEMKSRENEKKNGVTEINLINTGINKLKEELLEEARAKFKEI